MFTLCEPSGPVCAWADEWKRLEDQRRDQFEVFVSDDIASYPASLPGAPFPAVEQNGHAGQHDPAESVCRQPVTEPASPATIGVAPPRPAFVSAPRPQQSPTKRFHQSNSGSRRQMGGVKQTNRFFARRQFA